MRFALPTRAAIGFAFHLTQRRLLVRVAWGMGLLTALVGMGGAGMLARGAEHPPLVAWLLLVQNALAYGVAVLVAFGGATQAFRKDRDDGVRALLRARGQGTREYVIARFVALLVAVMLPTVGGMMLTGGVALAVAPKVRVLPEVVRAAAVGVGFCASFSFLVTLVALAALGARGRAGGYLVLLALFVVPDFLSPWTASLVPPAWSTLVSLPGIVGSARDALWPGTFDGPLLVRSLGALGLASVALAVLVRGELGRLDLEKAP